MQLAGRERELALLREKLAAAKDGTGGLVLIGGEAGIGKTTLAEALLREAAQAGRRSSSSGIATTSTETPPYGPWIDLFAALPAACHRYPTAARPSPARHVGAVPARWRSSPGARLLRRPRRAAARSSCCSTICTGRTPPASICCASSPARVAALPLLLLATYRTDELTRRHPLSPSCRCSCARPAPPHRSAPARRCRACARSWPSATRCRRRCGRGSSPTCTSGPRGTRFFVGELLRALEEEGALRRDGGRLGARATRCGSPCPPLLRQVIEARLARLGEESQRLLAVAAVIGQEVPLAVWAAVARGGRGDAARPGRAGGGGAAAGGDARRRRGALRPRADPRGALRGDPAHPPAAPPPAGRRGARGGAAIPTRTRSPTTSGGRATRARRNGWCTAGERALRVVRLRDRRGAVRAALPAADGRGRAPVALLHLSLPASALTSRGGIARGARRRCALATEAGDAALAALARCVSACRSAISGRVGRAIAEIAAANAALDALPAAAPARYARPRRIPPPTLVARATSRRADVAVRAAGGTRRRWRRSAARWTTRSPGCDTLHPQRRGRPSAWRLRGARPGGGRAGRLRRAAARYWRDRAKTGRIARQLLAPISCSDGVPPLFRRRPGRARAPRRGRWRRRWPGTPRRAVRRHRRRCSGRCWCSKGGGRRRARGGRTSTEGRVPGLSPRPHRRARPRPGEPEMAWRLVREACCPTAPPRRRVRSLFMPMTEMQRLAAALALDTGDLPTARSNGWRRTTAGWRGAARCAASPRGRRSGREYHRQAGDMDRPTTHAERALAHATEPRQPLALLAAHRLLGELDTEAGRYDDAAAPSRRIAHPRGRLRKRRTSGR